MFPKDFSQLVKSNPRDATEFFIQHHEALAKEKGADVLKELREPFEQLKKCYEEKRLPLGDYLACVCNFTERIAESEEHQQEFESLLEKFEQSIDAGLTTDQAAMATAKKVAQLITEQFVFFESRLPDSEKVEVIAPGAPSEHMSRLHLRVASDAFNMIFGSALFIEAQENKMRLNCPPEAVGAIKEFVEKGVISGIEDKNTIELLELMIVADIYGYDKLSDFSFEQFKANNRGENFVKILNTVKVLNDYATSQRMRLPQKIYEWIELTISAYIETVFKSKPKDWLSDVLSDDPQSEAQQWKEQLGGVLALKDYPETPMKNNLLGYVGELLGSHTETESIFELSSLFAIAHQLGCKEVESKAADKLIHEFSQGRLPPYETMSIWGLTANQMDKIVEFWVESLLAQGAVLSYLKDNPEMVLQLTSAMKETMNFEAGHSTVVKEEDLQRAFGALHFSMNGSLIINAWKEQTNLPDEFDLKDYSAQQIQHFEQALYNAVESQNPDSSILPIVRKLVAIKFTQNTPKAILKACSQRSGCMEDNRELHSANVQLLPYTKRKLHPALLPSMHKLLQSVPLGAKADKICENFIGLFNESLAPYKLRIDQDWKVDNLD